MRHRLERLKSKHVLLLLLFACLLGGGKLPTRCGVCDAGSRGAHSALNAIPKPAWTKRSDPTRHEVVFSKNAPKKRLKIEVTVAQSPATFKDRTVVLALNTYPPVVAPASCKKRFCIPVNLEWKRKCRAENPGDPCSNCYRVLFDKKRRNGFMGVTLRDPQGKELEPKSVCARHFPPRGPSSPRCASPGFTIRRQTSTKKHAVCDKAAGRCTMTIMAELRANVLSCEGITHLLSWEGSHPPGLDKLPCTPRSISTAFIEATATIHGPRAKKCKSCAKPAPPGDLTVTVQVTDLP